MTQAAPPEQSQTYILRHGLPGFLATTLIAIGALGIGWLPVDKNVLNLPLIGTLHGSLTGSLTSRVMVIVGLAVLLQTWLVLGTDLNGQRRIKRMWAILAIWAIPLILAPPLFSRDAYSYYDQGKLQLLGADPTSTGVSQVNGWFQDGSDPMWTESPTPYGPLFLLIERWIAQFTNPHSYFAIIGFRLVSLAGVAMMAWAAPVIARHLGADPARTLWLGVLNPLIVMHFISGAHNDALMVGLVMVGFALAVRNQCLWAAVAVAGAATIKPIALLALPFIGLAWAGVGASWWRRIRCWAWCALAAVITAACAYLVAQTGYSVIKAAFVTPSGVLTWLSPSTALGQLAGYATTWAGWTQDVMPAVGVFRAIGTLLSLGVLLRLIITSDRRNAVRGAAMAFAAVVVLGPVVQPWYLLWFLPLFAAAGMSFNESRIAVIVTAAFAVHGMVEASTNSDNMFDITDLITFATAVAIVAVVLLASPRERQLVLGNR